MTVFVHAQGIKTVHAGRGGGDVKKWQNSVHVVVECPLSQIVYNKVDFFCVKNRTFGNWFSSSKENFRETSMNNNNKQNELEMVQFPNF